MKSFSPTESSIYFNAVSGGTYRLLHTDFHVLVLLMLQSCLTKLKHIKDEPQIPENNCLVNSREVGILSTCTLMFFSWNSSNSYTVHNFVALTQTIPQNQDLFLQTLGLLNTDSDTLEYHYYWYKEYLDIYVEVWTVHDALECCWTKTHYSLNTILQPCDFLDKYRLIYAKVIPLKSLAILQWPTCRITLWHYQNLNSKSIQQQYCTTKYEH